MRPATILAAMCAVGALAKPIVLKRDGAVVVETEVNVVTTVVVVGSDGKTLAPKPAATPAPDPAPVVQHSSKQHEPQKHAGASNPQVAPKVDMPQLPNLDATSYIGVGIQQHNVHRLNHSAPNVEWDDDLAASAQTLAAGCVFRHDTSYGPASNYGQNIASSSPPTGSTAQELKAVITDMWYNGEVNAFDGLYGQDSPDMSDFENWGHMSQVVWKGSTKIGCATQKCDNDLGYFTVCNYGPAGNMMGDFAQNVLQPRGLPTISI